MRGIATGKKYKVYAVSGGAQTGDGAAAAQRLVLRTRRIDEDNLSALTSPRARAQKEALAQNPVDRWPQELV